MRRIRSIIGTTCERREERSNRGDEQSTKPVKAELIEPRTLKSTVSLIAELTESLIVVEIASKPYECKIYSDIAVQSLVQVLKEAGTEGTLRAALAWHVPRKANCL